MSGGSYDYAFCKVEDMAGYMCDRKCGPLRRAFREHLYKVAEAMKAVEWVDSGDWGPEREEQAIRDCLGLEAPALELRVVQKEAEDVLKRLQKALATKKRK